MSGLGQLAQQIGQMLGQLMQGGGGGGDSGSTPTTGTTGVCTSSYYSESTTPTPTDPCAYYVAPGGGTGVASSSTDTTSQDLLNALNNSGNDNLLNALSGSSSGTTNTNTNSNTNINSDITTASSTGEFNPFSNLPVATSTAGLSGTIVTTPTAATFVANDIQGNTETSSFFGGDTIASFVSNLVGNWCTVRPWASGFIASIIPPSFFDGLCTNGGFTVGAPQPTANAANTASQTGANVNLTQTPVQHTQATPVVKQSAAPSTIAIPSRVDIWAVPPSVPLGARATIFWNTENVTNCTETSPDGSFNQTSLSGGAATVPLTESTTYTISCLDSQQNPATDYVTVNISN